VTQGSIVAFLIAGISWFAHLTHAVPYQSGVPTVLSQEAGLIFGHSVLGRVLFYLLQLGAISILFTGGNTSFSGFPFLTSFVAEDSFLPRWMSKRGHRLVFSSGITVLTVLALALLGAVGANTNNLVPFYAIGVFTGFAMAGFGMARYHRRVKEQAWRRRLVINLTAGVYTALVVVIFATVKFTEGAWLVVVVFPAAVFAFIRLNREYRMEADVLQRISSRDKPAEPPTYARRNVYVFVDEFDLATVAALRYARSLRPTRLRAVHFVIDSAKAEKLRQDWVAANVGIVLEFVDVPDRRITRAAAELAAGDAALPGVGVTVILPRRTYTALLGRLLHDRTADKIAATISRIPHAAATIVPFDVRSRLAQLNGRKAPQVQTAGQAQPESAEQAFAVAASPAAEEVPSDEIAWYEHPEPPPGGTPLGTLNHPGKATVQGRVNAVQIRPLEHTNVLAAEIADSTGQLTVLFYGRSHIPGLECGSQVRFTGQVGIRDGEAIMINPRYELLAADNGATRSPRTSKPDRRRKR
ncbi:MAG: amino acid permease, partial [Actinobacteria bacterium]|nr:amino acid permease [Actinomycetota bacterium]